MLQLIRLTRLGLIMKQINVYEAKTQLSKLLDRVESGEEIVIARNGRPVATLSAHRPAEAPRSGRGAWKGKLDMTRFAEADAEIERDFFG